MTMPDLLSELEEALSLLDTLNPHADDACWQFIVNHHAEIAAAVRDAAKWKGVESVMEMAADKIEGRITSACGLLLIDYAARVNAGKVELRFGGVTNTDTGELGDWTVRIEKAAMTQEAKAHD